MPHIYYSRRACIALMIFFTSILGGCMSMMSGYQKAANAHGSTFVVSRDSSTAAWRRLNDVMKRTASTTAPIIIANDSLIQTAPAIAKGSAQYTARRQSRGDSVSISIDYDYLPSSNYDFLGRALALENVNSMAFHAHSGWESYNMPDSLIPGYVAGTPIEPGKSAPKDGSVWLGATYGGRNWGAELGIRYKFIGASLAFADLNNEGTGIPDYTDTYIPHSSYETEEFTGDFQGWNLYLFWDIDQRIALYGFGGYYYRAHSYLDRSTVTGTYWKSHRETTYSDQTAGGGLGIHYGVTSWLMVGLGYGSINGGKLDIGWRF